MADPAPRHALRRLELAALVALILAAYLVPRAAALRGVQSTSALSFGDMGYHQHNADLIQRFAALGDKLGDPYLQRHPEALELEKPLLWPRGVYQVSRLFLGTFGPNSVWTVQLTNLLFSIVLLGSVVLLGRQLKDLRTGLWGALLTGLNPALVGHSWYFSLDYALAAMIAAALVLLIQTRGFSSLRWTLGFGAWSGLALVIKPSYPLYLLVPCVAALLVGRRDSDRHRHLRTAAGILGALLLAVLISWLLHGWTLAALWHELFNHFTGDTTGGAVTLPLLRPWTLRWAGSMLRFMVESFPWPLLLLALPGLALIHWPRRPVARRWLLLAFFWGTTLVLTLMANKMERYLQPLYPLLCLLTAWWIFDWLPRRWRIVSVIWTVAAYGAVLWLVHVNGEAFFIHDRHVVEDRYMYEVRMPSRAQLDGLRRLVHHPSLDLRPLVRAGVELAALEGSTRPLGLGVVTTPDFAGRHVQPNLFQTFCLGLSQQVRHRFLIGIEENQQRPDPRAAPAMLLLHAPAANLARAAPDHHVVVSREVPLPIWQRGELHTTGVRLSLLRRTTAD